MGHNIKNDFFSGSRTYWIKNNMIVIMATTNIQLRK